MSKKKAKKILITGGSGYIGQHLVKMLHTYHNYDIYTLDVVGEPDFRMNIMDGDNIERLGVKYKFHAIIHLAALVRMNESVKYPEKYYDTNLTGTINLLNNAFYDNFVFASTGGAERPTNPYGMSKRLAEDSVTKIAKDRNTIFRFYNVTGSDGFPPTNPDGLLFNLIQATKTGIFNLHGTTYNTKDGTCIREYVHVNDVCRSLIKAININNSEIQNLAYGEPKTVLEIVELFKKVNNVDFKIVEQDKRDGDAESMFLEKPSKLMVRNYSYEEMLKINEMSKLFKKSLRI